VGSPNHNYKEMTDNMKLRVFQCVSRSLEENHFIQNTFKKEIKNEFIEFKKISHVWILNNFESYFNLIKEYNSANEEFVIYNPYYRTKSTRDKMSKSLKLNSMNRTKLLTNNNEKELK
jgi:hypothetical protein